MLFRSVGVGRFASVEEATEGIELDRAFLPSGVDYTECYERYLAYDKLLNN